MWYKDDFSYHRRESLNRRRENLRESILLVNARVGEERKARLHRLGAIVVLTAVLAGTLWAVLLGSRYVARRLFTQNDRFVIRHLQTTTDGKLRPMNIREYAKIEEGMNLLAVDIRKVREDLESVPVVSAVEVRRQLPDTLALRVSERVPSARLSEGPAGYALAIDREGYVLGPSAGASPLPAILGARDKGLRPGSQVADPAVASALLLIDLCDSPVFSRFLRIKDVDVGNADYLDVRLARGERVLLSRDRIQEKLEKLCEIIKHSADMGKAIAAVDMTVDKNFPVQYQ